MRPALLSFGILSGIALASCGDPRVPAIPAAARQQVPAEAGPESAWSGRGRIEVDAGSRRISGDLLVKYQGHSVAMVVLADGGITMLSGTVSAEQRTVHACLDDLVPHAEALLGIAAAWLPYRGPEAEWKANARYRDTASGRRWYGGDPVLLRRIDGPSWPTQVADYRLVEGRWFAHALTAEAPLGASIRLQLRDVSSSP